MVKKMLNTISLKWFFGLMGLFVLTLLFSIIYHLPISWILAQPSVQNQLPNAVQLSPSHGTLWQGTTYVSTPEPIGKVSWELSFWALLTGQASVETRWQKEQSHLSGELNSPLFSEKGAVSVNHLNGQIDLPLLLRLINAPGLKELPIEGVLLLEQMDFSIEAQTSWPSVLTGQLILNHLNILGNALPKIRITPELKGEQLTLKIQGGESGWTLSGHLEVFKNRQYRIALKVTAQSQESMPDWAGLLRQQSLTVAVLNNNGRW